MDTKSIFIDTEAFFHKKDEIDKLLEADYELFTSNIVIYEFIDVITHELELAKNKKNDHRVKLLSTIRDRFPLLIIDSGINIKNLSPTNKILTNFYNLMDKYKMNIGDVFHLLTIKEHKINYILTKDGDWKRTKDLVTLLD